MQDNQNTAATTQKEENTSETEGGRDMQRGGSWSPAGEPAEAASKAEADGDEKSIDLSVDAARFDSSDVGVSADDLIQPGKTSPGL